MSRHTIGNKRGSVRGAPPQVYIGFGTYTDGDDREPWADALRLCKHFAIFAAGWVLIFFIIVILWATGVLPDEFAD